MLYRCIALAVENSSDFFQRRSHGLCVLCARMRRVCLSVEFNCEHCLFWSSALTCPCKMLFVERCLLFFGFERPEFSISLSRGELRETLE